MVLIVIMDLIVQDLLLGLYIMEVLVIPLVVLTHKELGGLNIELAVLMLDNLEI